MKVSVVNSCALLAVVAAVCSLQPVSAQRKLADFTYHGDGDPDSCDDDINWVGGRPTPRDVVVQECLYCSYADELFQEHSYSVESKVTSSFSLPLTTISNELSIEISKSETRTVGDTCRGVNNTPSTAPASLLA